MSRHGVAAADLARALLRVVHEYPDAVLVRNRVGNLSIIDGVGPQGYVGFVDLGEADAVFFDQVLNARARSRPTTPPHPSPG